MSQLEISLQAEHVVSFGGFLVSNTLLTSWLVDFFLLSFSLLFFLQWRRGRPNPEVDLVKILGKRFLELVDRITDDRRLSYQLFPLSATFFLFIVTANLLALLPGFLGSFFVEVGERRFPLLRSPNSDLNTTLALGVFSVVVIQVFSIRELGWRRYLRRFFNFSNPFRFLVGILEMISEGTKLLSFSFRLFGNIFAGEVILLLVGFLLPYFVPLPFMILEMFVGVIQAFIFAILTLSFIVQSRLLSRQEEFVEKGS